MLGDGTAVSGPVELREALLEKLQSGVADYDLVVPSDYMVRILIAEKLVQPLEMANVVRFRDLRQDLRVDAQPHLQPRLAQPGRRRHGDRELHGARGHAGG